MEFQVSDSTIFQVFRMRAAKDERVKDLLESMSWEGAAMELQVRLEERKMLVPEDPQFPDSPVDGAILSEVPDVEIVDD